MASNADSDSSVFSDLPSGAEENEVASGGYFLSSQQTPVTYAFEPLASDDRGDNAPHSDASSESDCDSDTDTARFSSTRWCSCGRCQVMPTRRECLCCQEISAIRHRLPDNLAMNCICDSAGFNTLVANVDALDLCLLLMSDVRAESLIRPIASRYVSRTMNIAITN